MATSLQTLKISRFLKTLSAGVGVVIVLSSILALGAEGTRRGDGVIVAAADPTGGPDHDPEGPGRP